MGFLTLADACIIGVKPSSFGVNKCKQAISLAHSRVDRLAPKWDRVLSEALKKLTPETGRLYMTSYANYFDINTEECNKVSFAPISMFQRKRLTKKVRKDLSDLVEKLNVKMEEAAKRAGEKVVFVNWDQDVANCHGRVCEAGVQEPKPDREELMFFQPSSRNVVAEIIRNIPGELGESIGKIIQEELGKDDDVVDSLVVARDIVVDVVENADDDYPVRGTKLGVFLPIKFIRSLHPKPVGHAVIAKRVLGNMESEAGMSVPAVTSDACPLSKQEIKDFFLTGAEEQYPLSELDLPDYAKGLAEYRLPDEVQKGLHKVLERIFEKIEQGGDRY